MVRAHSDAGLVELRLRLVPGPAERCAASGARTGRGRASFDGPVADSGERSTQQLVTAIAARSDDLRKAIEPHSASTSPASSRGSIADRRSASGRCCPQHRLLRARRRRRARHGPGPATPRSPPYGFRRSSPPSSTKSPPRQGPGSRAQARPRETRGEGVPDDVFISVQSFLTERGESASRFARAPPRTDAAISAERRHQSSQGSTDRSGAGVHEHRGRLARAA